MKLNIRASCGLFILALAALPVEAGEATLRGEIRDAATRRLLPARVYISSPQGWFFARSESPEGSAVEYQKQRANTSVEMHTTLSAHPFVVDLPAGEYTLVVERGKEYLPARRQLTVKDEPVSIAVELQRWIDMPARGWYSGETHVHRSLEELPNVVQAEDLNVALPLTAWVTEMFRLPSDSDRKLSGPAATDLITVDATHVIYPLNTEWEIFGTGSRRHTLGAVFALGHKQPIDLGLPPVRKVAEAARRQGALLDLDKHNWPWSMMIVPIMKVDLFELANNHVWRTEFGLPEFNPQYAPRYMNLQMGDRGFTEWGWIDFGFQTYYALLNCGFRLRPTAGTASGVHPVPLGFGRVYVELPGGFSYEKWMKGLDAGRSFVTTGPMLLVKANGREAGHTFANLGEDHPECHLTGSAESAVPLRRIEIVVNGRIAHTLKPANEKTARGGYHSPIDERVTLDGSSWVAVRCFEDRPDGRVRFAHTSPFHFDVKNQPLRPRPEETEYLVERIEDEIKRHENILPDAAMAEYREALEIYQKLDAEARRASDY